METEISIFEQDQVVVNYAGFWKRFGALMIDGLVLLPYLILNNYNQNHWKSIPALIVMSVLAIAYKPFMEYRYSATLGKMALGIKVVNKNYQAIDEREALLRDIFTIGSSAIYLIFRVMLFRQPGFADVHSMGEYTLFAKQITGHNLMIWITYLPLLIDTVVFFTDAQKRALHDQIAGTFVIYK